MNCKWCESCYKCPINWDCEVPLEDQSDYENTEGMYAILAENDCPEFWKD